jgi:hypothetical protein
MILGAALLVGAAYVRDSMVSGEPGIAAADSRPMVNWDVVGTSWTYWRSRAERGWTRLSQNIRVN